MLCWMKYCQLGGFVYDHDVWDTREKQGKLHVVQHLSPVTRQPRMPNMIHILPGKQQIKNYRFINVRPYNNATTMMICMKKKKNLPDRTLGVPAALRLGFLWLPS